jgi:hypothetical protein
MQATDGDRTACKFSCEMLILIMILIYLLTAVGLTPGGGSTVHFYTKQYIEQHN